MKTTENNDLMRAVNLLNFEQENMGEAQNVLRLKYKIPHFYISMLIHRIFHRLGNYEFTWPPKKFTSLWDQFHHVASEEVQLLQTQS